MKTYIIVSALAIISLMLAFAIRGFELDGLRARIQTLETRQGLNRILNEKP